MLNRRVLFGFISNNFEINKGNKLIIFLRKIKDKIIIFNNKIKIFIKKDKELIFNKLIFINEIKNL